MTITKLQAVQILSNSNKPTLEISLTLDNKYTANSVITLGKKELQGEIRSVYEKVNKEKSNIENFISKGIWNKPFKEQVEFDEYLEKFMAIYESSGFSGNLSFAISNAFLKASAKAFGMETYAYVAETFQTDLAIPKPMLFVLKNSNENCLIEEFHILLTQPKFRNNLRIGLNLIEKFNNEINVQTSYFKNDEIVLETFKKVFEMLKIGPKDMSLIVKVRPATFDKFRELETKRVGGLILDSVNSKLKNIEFESFGFISNPLEANLDKEKLRKSLKNSNLNVASINLPSMKTVSSAFSIIQIARSLNCRILIGSSDYSQEVFCSHFSIGIGADFISFGAASADNAVAKLNEILRIENSVL